MQIAQTTEILKQANPKDPALGIPDMSRYRPVPTSTRGETWMLNIQEHSAKQAGLHYDLRLNDPGSNNAYSWAGRYNLPKPGEKFRVIEQPTHRSSYMGFSGTIPHEYPDRPGQKVYGAGEVKSLLHTKVDVIESNKDKILFNIYKGKDVERYALIRTGGTTWIFSNYSVTTKAKLNKLIPNYKPKYKEISTKELHIKNPLEVYTPKVDGAHNTVILRPNKRVDVFSYRLRKNTPLRMDHTYKTDLYKIKSPSKLGTTVVRTELYIPGLSPEAITGILNSNTWKAREELKRLNKRLVPMLTNVVRYKGKNVEDAPYASKIEYMKEISEAVPELELPEMATTPQEKLKLLDLIKSKRHPLTEEGIVVYPLLDPKPIKAKFKKDFDVLITGVFAAKPGSKYHNKAIGGFVGIPENSRTQIRVGSGLNDELRRAAFLNPDKFIGSWIKVEAPSQYSQTGSLRQPVFKGFRVEKYRNV